MKVVEPAQFSVFQIFGLLGITLGAGLLGISGYHFFGIVGLIVGGLIGAYCGGWLGRLPPRIEGYNPSHD